MSEQFPMDLIAELAQRGDDIVRQMHGVYHALRAVQEHEMRTTRPPIDILDSRRYFLHDQARELKDVLHSGVTSEYSGLPPTPPRRRGRPYRSKDADNTALILPKLRKEFQRKECFCARPK